MFKTIKKVRLNTDIQINMACQDCKKGSPLKLTKAQWISIIVSGYMLASTVYTTYVIFRSLLN